MNKTTEQENKVGRRVKTLKPCVTLGLKRDYGNLIKTARVDANVSQLELATAIGYKSATAISFLESNQRDVSAYVLDRIIEVLDLPKDYFITKQP